jgi:hypothetical protein
MLSSHDDDAAELTLMNALIKSLHTIPLSVVHAHIEQTIITERLQTYKRRRMLDDSSFKSQKKN